MPDLRASLVAYWSLLAAEARTVAGAPVLVNEHLPALGANAAYPSGAAQLGEVDAWYASLGRPAALVLPEGEGLELAASNGGFRPEEGFALLGVEPRPPEPLGPVWVEQVAWSQGNALGGVLARAEELPEWADVLSGELARAMQARPELAAYLAYVAGEPAGMLLSAGGAAHLWGVTRAGERFGAAGALFGRAASDAGGMLAVAVPLERLGLAGGGRELGRCSVWVKR